MKKAALLSITVAALSLSACGSDSASYMVDSNSDNAFSLFRTKDYPGADWRVALALTHLPYCQRRGDLKSVASDKLYKAELFRDVDNGYLLNSSGTWYEIVLDKCSMKKIDSSPSSTGDSLGSWQDRDGELKFYPKSK